MMLIENKYEIGEIVYLITDDEQKQRIVYSVEIFANGIISYKLACGINTSAHYDFEISKELDEAKKINA